MKKSLTDANIYDSKNISELKLDNFLSNYHFRSKYILIIQSKTSECLKLTIYPINEFKKLLISFFRR